MNDDDLVAGYLGRLVQAARQLPPDRRAELIDEIADHIEQARALGDASGSDLRDLLRRLGEPEVIAAAASDSADDFTGAFAQRAAASAQPAAPSAQPAAASTQSPAGRGTHRQRWLDLTAVLLALGSALLAPVSFVLALLAWAVGIVMLLLSPRWPPRAKVLGAVTGTLALPLFGVLFTTLAENWNTYYGQQAGPFGWKTGGGPFVASILVTAAVLAVTLVGGRLLRYPLSQPTGPGPATAEGRTAARPAAAQDAEPATSARASG